MRIDMKGRQFGKLTVLEKSGVNRYHENVWICRCACGNLTNVRGSSLRNGHTKTCGNCSQYVEEDDHMRCVVASGRSFIFDKDDFPRVVQYKWSVSKEGYVLGIGKNGKHTKLHRLLLNDPEGVVDHINGDPSDCRKSNLRVATQHQNSQNSSIPKSSTTGFKGVCYDKSRKKYVAHIHPNRRMKFLGYYDSPAEAALVYDKAASFYFGEFAKLNFERKEAAEIANREILEMAV